MSRSWLERCLRLIAATSLIVPGDRRRDWHAEWSAEVEHRALWLARRGQGGAGWGLLLRTAGCVPHACWLRADEWRLRMIWQDVRYGLRMLRRRPAFTVLATLTLALAIGALTAVFSVVYGVLLRPLPLRDPARLVQIWENNAVKGWLGATAAPANLLDWRDRTKTFDGITCYRGWQNGQSGVRTQTLTGGGEAMLVRYVPVCANLFDVLGVSPALGRSFAPDEDEPGHNVVVISDGLWRARYAARPDIIGQTMILNGVTQRIIGVMPAGFSMPGAEFDVWRGLDEKHASLREMRRGHFLRVIARLKPGVTVAQAREDIQGVARQLSREYPDTNESMSADIGPLQEWVVSNVRLQLLIFLGAVGLVLLIACTNVASLLMAQSIERARELAVRTALGARRGRLLRQLVTESLLLSVFGSLAGVVIAVWAVRAFVAFGPSAVPRLTDVRIDGVMLAFAAAVGVATTVLFGLLPALYASRPEVMSILRDGGRGVSAGLRSQRARRVLVAAEVTLSVMLVICAGLLIRSFLRLQQVDPGIKPAHVLTFQLSLSDTRYRSDADQLAFFERLLAQLQALPGVRAAGTTTQLPLTGASWSDDATIEGRAPDDYIVMLRHKTASAGYFDTVGLRITRGRGFLPSDIRASGEDAARVVIINEATARTYFAHEDPVGRRITFEGPRFKGERWFTIVGVVENERQDSLAASVKPEAYEPMTQSPNRTMHVVLRGDGDPGALSAPVRQIVHGLDPELVLQRQQTFDTLIASTVSPQRFAMLLMSAFAGVALLLAVVGVYGVVSYSVRQRTSEIGVRLALGASPRQVSRLIVGQSLVPVIAGLLAGLIFASVVTRFLAAQLFEVSPIDPATFAGVTMILLAAAVLASVIPARRAMRIDPVHALRAE